MRRRSRDMCLVNPNPQGLQWLDFSAHPLLIKSCAWRAIIACRKSQENRSRLCRKRDRLRLYDSLRSLRFVFASVTKFTFGDCAKKYFQGARNIEPAVCAVNPKVILLE